jgi:hypothetical protein
MIYYHISKKKGYSLILTEYLKLYYHEYIDDFSYKYKHPNEPIVLNHNKSCFFLFFMNLVMVLNIT